MPILIALGPARMLPNPPVWNTTPAPVFTQGLAGQYVVPVGMVSDPNPGDTINITYVGTALPAGSGLTFFPGAPGVAYYSYNGTGSGSVSGARLRATDSTGQSTDSNFYTIVITPLPTSAFVDVTLTSAASGLLPFTFGQPCKKGDFPGDIALSVTQGQFTVLNRWSDGSVKFGIAAGRTTFTAGTPLTVRMQGGTPSGTALTLARLQQLAPTATLVVGGIGTASLAGQIGNPIEQVIAGPEMSEWIFQSDIDADLHVRWYVRLFADNRIAIFPSIGNGYVNSGPGLKIGQVTLTIGGVQRYQSSGTVSIYHHQRLPIPQSNGDWWWIGPSPSDPQITPKHDTAYLKQTKFVPNYFAPSAADVASYAQAFSFQAQCNLRPGHSMGGTGDDPTIGYLTGWEAAHIASSADPRTYRSVIVNSYATGNYSIHDPSATTKKPLKFSDWPVSTTPPRNGGELVSANTQYGLEWAIDHSWAPGYLAYLITGDRWHLEELQHCVGWQFLSLGAGGGYGSGLSRKFDYNQIRSISWGLWRNQMLAAMATPDADPLRVDYLAHYGFNVTYWNNGADYGGDSQKFTMGWQTAANLDSTANGVWYLPGGFKMQPFPMCIGNYCVGWGKDLEVDSYLTTAQQGDFAGWLTHTLTASVNFFGGSGAAEWNYKYAGIYDGFCGTDTASPFTYGSMYTVPGDAFTRSLGPVNNPSLPSGNNIMEMPQTGYWDYTQWSVKQSLATGFDYFPNMLCGVAKAVDHNIPGAAAAWDRVTKADNWLTLKGTAPNGGKYCIEPRVPVVVPPAGGSVLTDFVWPVYFDDQVAGQSVDMRPYVPGYVAGQTTLSVVGVNSRSTTNALGTFNFTDAPHLPDTGAAFNGTHITYNGSTGWGAAPYGAFRLVSTNPSWTSNKFAIMIAREPKAWRTAPRTSTGSFTTLQGILNGISSTTGGWARVTGTNLRPELQDSIWPGGITLNDYTKYYLGNGQSVNGYRGPFNIFETWASAVWVGNGFIATCTGGHGAGWNNEIMGIYFDDPPMAKVLTEGFPSGGAMNRGPYNTTSGDVGGTTYYSGNAGGDKSWKPGYCYPDAMSPGICYEHSSPVWGACGVHCYYGKAQAGSGRILVAGGNQAYTIDDGSGDFHIPGQYAMVWELDLTAANPRSAWRPISIENLIGNPRASWGCERMVQLANGDIGFLDWYQNKFRYRSVERDVILDNSLPMLMFYRPGTQIIAYMGWYNPFNGKHYGITKNAQDNQFVFYNFTDGVEVATLPGWAAYDPSIFVDASGGAVFVNATTAIYANCVGDGIVNGGGALNICKVNLSNGQVDSFAPYGNGGGEANVHGLHNSIGAIRSLGCIVTTHYWNQEAAVFKPPSSWGLVWS